MVAGEAQEVADAEEKRPASAAREENDRGETVLVRAELRLDVPVLVGQRGQERSEIEVVLSSIRVTGMALSVGAVWWAARAGGLLASLLASAPAWRHLDALPVLGRPDDRPRERIDWGEGEDAESKRDEAAVTTVLGEIEDSRFQR
jgi:hypothetical protein